MSTKNSLLHWSQILCISEKQLYDVELWCKAMMSSYWKLVVSKSFNTNWINYQSQTHRVFCYPPGYHVHLTHFKCDPDWKSWHHGNGCAKYKKDKWCTEEGDHYGPEWNPDWGKFEGWSDEKGRTALVCPECGCVKEKPGVGSGIGVSINTGKSTYKFYNRLLNRQIKISKR